MTYREVFPVAKGEDPLESREFYERCQAYRTAHYGDQENVCRAWDGIKDFVKHHYQVKPTLWQRITSIFHKS